MSSLQMVGMQGAPQLRVQRQFNALDDGRGHRAAALAEALGVIMDATPKVAEYGAKKAFKEGVEARIDGIKRENVDAAKSGVLGFMFSKQAKDGFDYQDAQLAIPAIQATEILEMEEKLHNSRNPEDLINYFASRDVEIGKSLDGRSDIYRYTVAKELQKTRQDQARLFTSWVQSNRDKDRSAAASAAAKAAAAKRSMQLDAAGTAAFDAARSGDKDWFGNFVKTAQEVYGITAEEAKAIALEQVMALADLENDPRLLHEIDPTWLSSDQRATLANARDTLTAEKQAYDAQVAKVNAQAEKDRVDAEVAEASNRELGLSVAVATGSISISGAATELLNDPYFRNNPAERSKALERLNKLGDTYTDPAVETITVSKFKEDAIALFTIGGDMGELVELTKETLGSVRSKASREEVAAIANNLEKYSRDALFSDLDSYYTDIRQTFPSGVGQDQTVADLFVSDGAGSKYSPPEADTRVKEIFNNTLLALAGDWYAENPDAPKMPYRVRIELADQAYAISIERGKRKFKNPNGGEGLNAVDPAEFLNNIAGSK